MSAIKATPTGVLLKEYGNYTLMTSIAAGSILVAYGVGTGELPGLHTVVLVSGGLATLPAIALAGRSLGKMWKVSETPIARQRIVSGGGLATERSVNGIMAFFHSARLAFDPSLRNDPDIASRTIKYKEPPKLKFWDVEITRRSNLLTVITVNQSPELLGSGRGQASLAL